MRGLSLPRETSLQPDHDRDHTLPSIIGVHVRARVPPVINPLGEGNDSIKRFFPIDEDDADLGTVAVSSTGVGLAPIAVDNSKRSTPKISHSPESMPPRESHEQPLDSGHHPEPLYDMEAIVKPANTKALGSLKEELYRIVNQVGEGTFGKVYKAQNLVSRAYVALKLIRMEGERDGFPVTAMREIKLLQSLHHTNIVNLHEMMVSKG